MGMAYNWKFILSVSICLIQAVYSSEVYIVYLGGVKNQDAVLAKRSHLRLLSAVFSSEEDAKQSLLYSYRLHISGFSAKLNSSQANTLSRMKGVVTVFRSTTLQLHTTRSWDFMDLTLAESQMMPIQLAYGKDVVVGIFDTGIWPELKSFQEDLAMGPLPLSWKGRCVEGEKFNPTIVCNHKLIGARYYIKGFEQEYGRLNTSCSANGEYLSARDCLGHGTHTASTAVGSVVDDASFIGGLGAGTARGGAPRARLAIYKVCWSKDLEGKCTEADILAAFDDALHDGVHIISASFGSAPPLPPFFASSAGIGSFHAMQLGITVVFSAGNDGPDPSLVQNVAPWAICVGASSIDRAFPTEILLDQNISITGESLLTEQIKGRLVDARAYFTDGICRPENWNKRVAVGRIILCFSTIGMVSSDLAEAGVVLASGLGLIFVEPMSRHIADVSIIPTIWVDYTQGSQILNYLSQSPKLPKIQIAPSRTTIGKTPAPTIAYFSSKGPSSISPEILKPDISAPGVSILAAWPPEAPPTLYAKDGRSVRWNFQSGTSMSCPHVAGAAALVKSAHRHWSPSAIRSALMTTAYAKDKNLDNILVGGSMEESNPFDFGAGHMNPLKAMDPGLVYDMKPTDYVRFLCNIGYNDEQIRSIASFCPSLSTASNPDYPPPNSGSCSCPKASIASSQSNANLNYPSITVLNLQSTTTIKRTLRNVGQMKTALYFASVECPNGVGIHVWPRLLFFSSCRNEISFYVTLTPEKTSQGRYDFGEILWTDGFHFVRTPLIVLVNTSVFTTMDTL